MSLINDMLRDLEARRATEQRLPAGLRSGVVVPAPAGGTRRALFIVLGITVLALAAAAIWLGWQRYGATTPAPVPIVAAPAPAAPVVAPVKEMSRGSESVPDVVVAAVPPPDTRVVPAAVPEVAPAPAPPATDVSPAATIPAASTPAAAPRPAAVVAQAPVETMAVEKTARAPTPQQQAEIEYQQGVRALRGGNHAAAESAFRAALRADNEHLLARETLAAMLLGAGRLIEADEVLEQGRRFFARNPTLALLLARLRMEQGQNAAAVTILEQSLHVASARADYLAFLAALYQRELRYNDSVESYGRALALQPQQASWWVGMGISLENAGRREDAIKAYEQAAEGTLPSQLQEHVQSRLQALK